MYLLGFIIALIGLGGWFYFQDSNQSPLMRFMFIVGLGMYAYSVFSAEAAVNYKFGIAFRDLIFLGWASLLFSANYKNAKRFIPAAALVFSGGYLFYSQFMKDSFPQKVNESTIIENDDSSIQLAESAELLVEVKNGYAMSDLEAIIKKYDLTFERAFFPERGDETELDDYYFLNIPDERLSELKKIEADLVNSGLTDWVEGNEIFSIDPTELKSYGATQKNNKSMMNDPDIKNQWGFEKMETEQLYALLKKTKIVPQKRALIAILDTGVAGNHEDLKDNYFSIDGQYDNDPIGHGTHCAGIAAAVSNNKVGIASLAPDNRFVQVTSIKVLNAGGSGTQGKIIKGITLAADSGADVISLSLGGFSSKLRQRAYNQAVEYATEAGAIVVCAAGNSNMNSKRFSPANTKGVITVSAVDTLLKRAHFSNTVQDVKMGIAAPGVKVFSTIPNNRYAFFNGTSMATPYVSGLIGLMKSIHPKLTAREAYEILHKTGVETDRTNLTGKFIQPAAAIEDLID